jgi:hypothetical protein
MRLTTLSLYMSAYVAARIERLNRKSVPRYNAAAAAPVRGHDLIVPHIAPPANGFGAAASFLRGMGARSVLSDKTTLQSDDVPVAERIMATEDDERRATFAYFADQMIDDATSSSPHTLLAHRKPALVGKLPDLTRVNGFEYKPGELVLSPNSPLESARRLVIDRYTTETGLQLLFRHRGIFYCWQESHYKTVPTDYLKADVNLFLECARRMTEDKEGKRSTVPFHPKQAHVNEVVGALASVSFLGESLDAPLWLGGDVPDLAATEIIACENGLLHLPSRSLLPHTPLFFSHTALDYPFDAGAPEPTQWLSFLAELWPTDQDSINTLQ